jgi:hypothetical protein
MCPHPLLSSPAALVESHQKESNHSLCILLWWRTCTGHTTRPAMQAQPKSIKEQKLPELMCKSWRTGAGQWLKSASHYFGREILMLFTETSVDLNSICSEILLFHQSTWCWPSSSTSVSHFPSGIISQGNYFHLHSYIWVSSETGRQENEIWSEVAGSYNNSFLQ